MTIDYLSSRETASLVAPAKPNFYPQAKIDLQHNQLKHRISTGDSDPVYFCSGHDIFALHTSIQKRELIRSLSWAPKCLDAGYGWVCAGASNGQCAFIRVAKSQDGHSHFGRQLRAASVDDQLPLDLDPASRSPMNLELHALNYDPGSSEKYGLRYHTLGKDIVNSVVIHRMKSLKEGFEDETVVIATNNDKTVQIFSLSQSKPLATLTYVTPMNHASMSPDGNLILAVGDRGQAFFHRRIPFENSAVGDKAFMTSGWIAIGEPLLRQVSDIDACFSTAFSPSGHRCVVASEGGIITVFDTSLINDEMEGENAVICIMKTSRPSTRPDLIGAARAVSFSPPPWDLLAVAEDQGRVLVLDLRDPEFLFRQTLELSVDPSDVVWAQCSTEETNTRVTLEHMQRDIERRLLESRRDAAELRERYVAISNSRDELERTILRQGTPMEHSDRTLDIMSYLIDPQGFRRSPSQNETLTDSMATTNNVSTTSSSGGSNALPTPHSNLSDIRADWLDAREQHTDRLAASLTDISPSISAFLAGRDQQNRSSASIADYVHQRNIERERQQRTSDRQPRRRSSVVITNSNNRHTTNNSSTLAPIGTATPTISTSPSRLPSSSSSTLPAPPVYLNHFTTPDTSAPLPENWQQPSGDGLAANTNSEFPHDTIAEAGANLVRVRRSSGLSTLRRSASVSRSLGASGATNDPRLNQQTTHPVLTRADLAVLQRTRERLANRMRDLGQDTITIEPGTEAQSHAGGVVIQGLGWSQSGRSLFVATENGMLEYQVNIRERMQWPGGGFL